MVDLRALWTRLVDGLWFVPGIIVLGSILLAIGMIELSAGVSAEALARWPRVFGASAAGARSMLAAIAGSMITVAGVTFSITMVAVTQASSQYTPRILRNFMRDRANQIVLGSFVGIFAYCLVVLRTIRGADGLTFVPSLAVLLGVLLAIVGIAVLIFFVHHIATTLQASEIVARIARETIATVDRMFPEELGADGEVAGGTQPPTLPSDGWRPVTSAATGYLQGMDGAGLERLAGERELVIRLEHRIGDFVIAGLPLVWLAPAPGRSSPPRERTPDEAIAARFVIGRYRTIDQDPSFGIRQLVDIALKALSPGINDTTTAVTCIDYLGAILVRVAGRRVEAAPAAQARVSHVVGPRQTFARLLSSAFDEIRRNAAGQVNVLARQLGALEILGRQTRSAARLDVLRAQIELIEEMTERTVPAARDRAELHALAGRAAAASRPGA